MKLADVYNPSVPADMGTNSVNPAKSLSHLLNTLIEIILVVGALTFVFMLLFGAFQWITSGGDKDALVKARGRMVNAVIGLIILFSVFAFLSLFGSFLGLSLTDLKLP